MKLGNKMIHAKIHKYKICIEYIFMDASNKEKIRLIKIYLDEEEKSENVDKIYNIYLNIKKKNTLANKVNIKINNKKKCNINDQQYIVLLKFLNIILTNINKPNIKKLEEFKNIDRLDIIKEENEKSLNDMEDEIYKHYDKAKCGWYRRKSTKSYILTFIRYACNIIGYSFQYNQKDIITRINKRNMRDTHIIYYIK